ncbi:MAG TPA: hypothetical protein PLJ60_16685 [Chryseolinea sp.]|nr:hypothetical protein [Chryseolinea sp.]HPM31974.1 hypothetical protein [Chryseolinea sp.]
MKQQPDKLFREKLEGFQKPAPASAWDKIETNLDKQNSKGLWWKVAASLLLIAVSAYLLWPKNVEQTEAPIANKNIEETKSIPASKEKKVNEALPSPIQNSVVPTEATPKNNVARIDKQKDQPKEKIQEPILAMTETVTPTKDKSNEVATLTENVITPEVVATTEITTEKSGNYITLVVTAEEANKYLIKNTNSEATSDDTKTSSLRKLLNKASDLTNDQRPLADLRQMKDEILALNFDSKKQRGQNKQ